MKKKEESMTFKPSLAMQAAVREVEASMSPITPDPTKDDALVKLRQLYIFASRTFERCKLAVSMAEEARSAAEDQLRDIQVRIELREEQLGIIREETEEEFEEHA